MKASIRTSLLLMSCLLIGGCSGGYAPVVSLGVAPQKAPPSYRVKRGDTLYSIAWTYALDYRQLASLNHLDRSYRIWPGQQLRLKQRVSRSALIQDRLLPKKNIIPVGASLMVRGNWHWPTKGQVIQGFEPGLAGNAGVDISGKIGQPVFATRPGRVVYSGDGVRGYGNLIIIKHSNDFLSAYAFNRRNLVRVGSQIHRGQKVAIMGRNRKGRAVLHFEIRRNGQPVNPLRFLS